MLNHNILNKIGGVAVFTIEGAADAYRRFAARCFSDFSMESSAALSAEADKLHALGFSWSEIESLELEAIA